MFEFPAKNRSCFCDKISTHIGGCTLLNSTKFAARRDENHVGSKRDDNVMLAIALSMLLLVVYSGPS